MGKPKDKEIERCRLLYVEGDMPLNRIAQHCGINVNTLRGRIKRGGWRQQKEAFLAGEAVDIVREAAKLRVMNAARSYLRAAEEEREALDARVTGGGWYRYKCIELEPFVVRTDKAAERLKGLGVNPDDVALRPKGTVHALPVPRPGNSKVQQQA